MKVKQTSNLAIHSLDSSFTHTVRGEPMQILIRGLSSTAALYIEQRRPPTLPWTHKGLMYISGYHVLL